MTIFWRKQIQIVDQLLKFRQTNKNVNNLVYVNFKTFVELTTANKGNWWFRIRHLIQSHRWYSSIEMDSKNQNFVTNRQNCVVPHMATIWNGLANLCHRMVDVVQPPKSHPHVLYLSDWWIRWKRFYETKFWLNFIETNQLHFYL